jgi:enterochelin esterase-like enzyme
METARSVLYLRICELAFALIFAIGFTASLLAQTDLGARKGSVERIKVHGKGLEENLSGDPADRDVCVYLPASYGTDTNRRYPVLYMLHGYTDSDDKWFGLTKHWINLPLILDKAFAGGPSREMIVVMPNAYTRFQGSMYSSSVTTGNWEDFVARELVAHIDAHYRTIAARGSRGLAGHSMGGYGAMRIGMKNPEIFSSLYLLSPCCMAPQRNTAPNPERNAQLEAIHNLEDFEKAAFGTKAAFASAAAWSPNPNNPPFFLDLPLKGSEPQPLVAAKWAANAPLAMIDAYILNLRHLQAIAFDAGKDDRGIAGTVRDLDQILNDYKMDHTFEIYDGDHVNRIAERIETKVLPFFTKNLSFE